MGKDLPQVIILGILERIQLANILGTQNGNLATVQVIQQMVKDLSLTEEEMLLWGVVSEGTSVQWSARVEDTKKPFTFTPWRLSKVREVLRQIDERSAVGLQWLSLFEAFGVEPAVKGDMELAEEYAALQGSSDTDEAKEPTPIRQEQPEPAGV